MLDKYFIKHVHDEQALETETSNIPPQTNNYRDCINWKEFQRLKYSMRFMWFAGDSISQLKPVVTFLEPKPRDIVSQEIPCNTCSLLESGKCKPGYYEIGTKTAIMPNVEP